jgi:anaerobic magnesium-protoporphyrin IX monomethyl ester cyclase
MSPSADVVIVIPNAPQSALAPNGMQSLGAAQVAASCAARGLRPRIIDAYLEELSPDQVAARLRAAPPARALGFYIPDAATLEHALRTLVRLEPSVPVAFGGPYATMLAHAIVTRFAVVDAVVRGEADDAFPAWVETGTDRGRWREVPNLVFVDAAGGSVATPMTRRGADLDALPFPDREQTLGPLRARDGALTLSTSRGCYAPCSFCLVQRVWSLAGGAHWRGYGAGRVLEELAFLVEHLGARALTFVDDDFFGPGEAGGARALAIAEGVRRLAPSLRLALYCRPDDVVRHPRAVDALVEAGWSKALLGVEAGSAVTLARYDKHLSAETSRAAVRILRERDVRASLGVVFFHPWSTVEETAENLDFWERLLEENPNASTLLFGAVVPLPGTALAAQLAEEGRFRPDGLYEQEATPADAQVAALAGAWELLKARELVPLALEASRRGGDAGRERFAWTASRLQIPLLRACLAAVRRGERSAEEIAARVSGHPAVAALRREHPGPADVTQEERGPCTTPQCI